MAQTAKTAENLGFDSIWVPDSQLIWRDVFSVLSLVATQTESIRLGTAVTNVATRHPSVVASAARTIGELSEGRFQLGLGVGNSSVAPIGRRSSTRAELRDGVQIIRDLLDGRTVDFEGVNSRLRDPCAVPIHVAASGPKNLALAGEIADGIILLSGVSESLLRSALEHARTGAELAGRDFQDIDVTVSAFCHLTRDPERDARQLKPICAGIAQNGGGAALAMAGIHIDVPRLVPDVYPDVVHAEDWELAIDLVSAWVSDEDALRFARSFCLFGGPGEVAERIRGIQQLGATEIFIQHVGSYSMPDELMDDFSREVMPLLDDDICSA